MKMIIPIFGASVSNESDNIIFIISRFCGEPPFVWRGLHSCPSQGGDRSLGRILRSCVFS